MTLGAEPYDDSRESDADELPPPEAEPAPPAPRMDPPINWWTLSGDDRAAVIATVDRFLKKLHLMYELDSSYIRPCWFLHPSVIQEALALWQYRSQHAYLPDQTAIASLEFHIQLGPALARIKAATKATTCTPGDHKDYKPVPIYAGTQQEDDYKSDLREHLLQQQRAGDRRSLR